MEFWKQTCVVAKTYMVLIGSMIFGKKDFVSATTYMRLIGSIEVWKHKKACLPPKVWY
jgi:hypothetical protein